MTKLGLKQQVSAFVSHSFAALMIVFGSFVFRDLTWCFNSFDLTEETTCICQPLPPPPLRRLACSFLPPIIVLLVLFVTWLIDVADWLSTFTEFGTFVSDWVLLCCTTSCSCLICDCFSVSWGSFGVVRNSDSPPSVPLAVFAENISNCLFDRDILLFEFLTRICNVRRRTALPYASQLTTHPIWPEF